VGTIPRFVKSVGFDIIITNEGRAVLIELQHFFGRRGLIKLFPDANRIFRSNFKNLREEFGFNLAIRRKMRKICRDKVNTYELFSDYQPSSFIYRKWTPAVHRWIEGLNSSFVLAKPPHGSCGKGILVFKRNSLRNKIETIPSGHIYLLQEHISSKSLTDNSGKIHAGCIRHIAILHSDGNSLNFIHTPSYWRVSPVHVGHESYQEAFIANISRGAYPVIAEKADGALSRNLAERVGLDLIAHIFQCEDLQKGSSRSIISR